MTAIYALSHFAVDLACAHTMFASTTTAFGYLLYNFLAFAMQMPLGLLADRLNKNRLLAILGTALVFLGCLWPSVLLLGLGNALFHLGGGLDVLNSSHRAAPLGVFVSPGALGIFLGAMAILKPFILVLLVLSILFMAFMKIPTKNIPFDLPSPTVFPAAALLFLIVVLRSYGGMAASFSWKTGVYAWLAILAVVFGKAAGGFLSDRFGLKPAACATLGLSALCFLLGETALFGILALFFFNMTMPMTLHALAQRMPGCKGFSFGLLTFALFLGFLPTYLGAPSIAPTVMTLTALASLLLFTRLRTPQ